MTDEQVVTYLSDNGYPDHIVRGGRAGLISRWNRFVEEVARGYRYGLEDYRNDLDLRGIIALAGLDKDVEEADERLRTLLRDVDKRVWESGIADAFWDFGYPKNARGDLREDLEAEGLYTEADESD
jgi:hypothetical protein